MIWYYARRTFCFLVGSALALGVFLLCLDAAVQVVDLLRPTINQIPQ